MKTVALLRISYLSGAILDFRYMALCRKGRKNIESRAAIKIKLMLLYLSGLLKYYCEHQKIMEAADAVKIFQHHPFAGQLPVKDKLKLLGNRLAVRNWRAGSY